MSRPLLEVEGLRKYFPVGGGWLGRGEQVRAVDGVDLTIGAGETVGLVGESGCGKSVSALSILRLIPWPPGKIIGGSIHFSGQDLLALSDDEIRKIRGRELSIVFQEPITLLKALLV